VEIALVIIPVTNVIYLVDYKEMLVILAEENNKMLFLDTC